MWTQLEGAMIRVSSSVLCLRFLPRSNGNVTAAFCFVVQIRDNTRPEPEDSDTESETSGFSDSDSDSD